ncbi:hypothetical protein AX16_009209 [Volvariella volvacea WC 439]|nr:hypothetical protein AX16_009209 [Volvariella volvacea WC 439]
MFCSAFFLATLVSQLVFTHAAVMDKRSAHSSSVTCGLNIDHEQAARLEQQFARMRPDPSLVRADNQGPAEVDVYWNIIATNRTREGGWIPHEILQEQMRAVNEDLAVAGFRLNHVRTRRIMNSKWFNAGVNGSGFDDPNWHEFASRFREGGPETLNIYTIPLYPDGLMGIGTPGAFYEEFQYLDGILLNPVILPGGPIPGYGKGKTFTHEVGHWLGLWHTFNNGCDEPGDYVDDTAPQAGPTEECNNFQASCGIAPTINNYMDYIPDACRLVFTPGQIARMQEQTRAYRGIAC